QGATRSGRWARPRPFSTQSPQLRAPSEAVHGRSNAKRKTLTVATRTAAPHTGHGRPNTAAYWPESAAPISPRSLRALDDEAKDPARFRTLDDAVARAPGEGLDVGRRAGVGGEHLDGRPRHDLHDGLRQLHARPRARKPAAVDD